MKGLVSAVEPAADLPVARPRLARRSGRRLRGGLRRPRTTSRAVSVGRRAHDGSCGAAAGGTRSGPPGGAAGGRAAPVRRSRTDGVGRGARPGAASATTPAGSSSRTTRVRWRPALQAAGAPAGAAAGAGARATSGEPTASSPTGRAARRRAAGAARRVGRRAASRSTSSTLGGTPRRPGCCGWRPPRTAGLRAEPRHGGHSVHRHDLPWDDVVRGRRARTCGRAAQGPQPVRAARAS